MNVGVGSLHHKFHEFSMPVGGATNMSRAYFGNFSYLFLIVMLNNLWEWAIASHGRVLIPFSVFGRYGAIHLATTTFG